jgi:hypothetical protein
MRYEIDHERRRVQVFLDDGFDSYLLIGLCRLIERQESIRLIDNDPFGIEGPNRPGYRLTVDAFGSTFDAELATVVVEPGVITVVLKPAQT